MVDLRFPNQDLRNKDYKDVAAGDETHRYGDYVPFVAADEEELTVGDLFALNTDGEAVAFERDSDDHLAGVVYSNTNDETGITHQPSDDAVVEGGEAFTGKVQGTVVASNEDSNGDEVYSDTADSEADVGERGPAGELPLETDEDEEFVHLLLP